MWGKYLHIHSERYEFKSTHFCFMISTLGFVKYSCVIYGCSCIPFYDKNRDVPICCCICSTGFLGSVSNLAPILSRISSMSHLHIHTNTSHIVLNYFPVWNWHICKCLSNLLTTLLEATVLSIFTA